MSQRRPKRVAGERCADDAGYSWESKPEILCMLLCQSACTIRPVCVDRFLFVSGAKSSRRPFRERAHELWFLLRSLFVLNLE